MQDDLTALETWASTLLARLDPAARRKLTSQIAQDLRRAQQQRIKAQQTPEGTPYTPRKPRKALRSKKERIKKQKAAMFAKLRTNTHLKTKADGNDITVGFFGRVARIARVHQSGLNDRVAKDGPEVTYAERRLIGFNQTDKETIQESILSLIRS
ncbi:phage virion morphogenesis protein [Undibacterium umbellatum]|uniref:Phage virion morphogenesis protein n=1 Tax=Undibacterium umbellatum TaxID=2762300 RepID=A0ABR6ZIR3_9BURK|nr:phage virion morphogenesis protein [Undibacterium umbellatum]MBC3911613.1 phage virion morphogenesis protein [Undibacterium umbellatum]